MIRAPRLIRRALARASGFFWLPCPVCEREFGGGEKGGGILMLSLLDPSVGRVTCPRCPGYFWPDATPMDEAEYLAIGAAHAAFLDSQGVDRGQLGLVRAGEIRTLPFRFPTRTP